MGKNPLAIRVTTIVFVLSGFLGASEPKIDLMITIDRNAPIDAALNWTNLLEKIDLNRLRIQSAKTARISVDKTGEGTTTQYQVTGLIDRQNTLRLPGGRFRLNQLAKIKEWRSRLVAGQVGQPQKERTAFGLSDKQLVQLFDELAKPVSFSTKGKSASDALISIRDLVGIQIGVSPAARSRLDSVVTEELRGVSCGTATAALLRPQGLVLVPQLKDQTVVLAVTDVRESKESWPIGWPPEKRTREILPKLFDRLNVEIADTSLQDVLTAIQQKLHVPFLYDQNSLARNNVELKTTIVKFPARQSFYKRVIDHILTNQFLQAEIRVDEAGNPFVWISSSRRG